MYKKFLNAILFGALILGSAGTITSCKDYDDEIDEINQKLNTLSSKDELAAQVSQLTGTISAAQAAAAQASTEAANALANAKEAAAQAEAAAANAGVASGQSAEAINGAKAAATTADNAAAAAKEAAATAAKAAEDAAKAIAAGADATKALADAKKAADAAAATAKEAAEAAAAAKKAGEEAASAAGAAAAKAVADAQVAIADAAKKVAEESAKEAAAAAVALELKAINDRLEKLEKGGGSVDPKALEEIQKAVEEAKKAVDGVIGKIAGAVTEVSLVDSYTAKNIIQTWWNQSGYVNNFSQGAFANAYWNCNVNEGRGNYTYAKEFSYQDLELGFTTAIEKSSYTFAQGWDKWDDEHAVKASAKWPAWHPQMGEKLDGAFTFVEGQQVQTQDAFVVRVSPTNAVLKPEQIQLVNSVGQSLNEILQVDAVIPFTDKLTRPAGTEYITTRAEEETGLWIVIVSLKNYDEKTFNELTMELEKVQGRTPLVSKADTRAQHNQDEYIESEDGLYLINRILYAVQVNNTQEDAAERFVTSSYDLSLAWTPFQAANRLHFSVNGRPVESINNRATKLSRSFLEKNTFNFFYGERAWLGDSVDVKANINYGLFKDTADLQNADSVSRFTEYWYTEQNGQVIGYNEGSLGEGQFPDDRSAEEMIPAVNGQTLTISLDPYQGWAYAYGEDEEGNPDPRTVDVDAVETAKTVRAMYVVLDQPNSIESKPSEWAAWTSYKYTGLNEVVEGTSVDITIDCGEHKGDIIGFRVYAVNYDGTLVDPDGRAFYVQLGADSASGTIDTKIVPENDWAIKEDTILFSDPEEFVIDVTGATAYKWTADMINYLPLTTMDEDAYTPTLSFYPALFNKGEKNILPKNAKWSAANGSVLYDDYGYVNGFEGELPADYSQIGLLATVPNIPDWLAYIDGKPYAGTLTLYNVDKNTGTKRVLKSIRITFTKELPTAAPKGYSPKDKQIIEGLYEAYLIPMDKNGKESWTAKTAVFGSMPMLHVFDFGTNDHVTRYGENYQITFAASDTLKNAKGEAILDANKKVQYTAPLTILGCDTLKVPAVLIDNKTKHATTVAYNFGKISTALYQKALEQSKVNDDVYTNYTITVDQFDTEYHDIYDSTYTWHWMNLAEYKVFTGNDKATQAQLDAARPTKVKYGAGSGEPGDAPAFFVELKYILGQSWDGKYDAPLSAPYQGSLEIASVTLTSDANGKEEYFEVTYDKNTGKLNFAVKQDSNGINAATNPKQDVPSTLNIKVVDMYSHQTHMVKMPMTVLKR